MHKSSNGLPVTIDQVAQLEDLLSEPTSEVVECLSRLDGDLIILGVGGKMGPTLASMVCRADQWHGKTRRVLGVSRFTDARARQSLDSRGVETIACDLLDQDALDRLPDAPNVVAMTGMKFG